MCDAEVNNDQGAEQNLFERAVIPLGVSDFNFEQ